MDNQAIEDKFKVGQYIIYKNCDNYELGKIKSLKENGAFIYYHTGETAALTNYDNITPIENDWMIKETLLGGRENYA